MIEPIYETPTLDAMSEKCGASNHEMKRALLIDADSVKDVDNLAIGKFITDFESKNYHVEVLKLKYPAYPHKKEKTVIDASGYSAVRVSIIFKRNKDMIEITGCNDVMFGGTGYEVKTKLPKEIDDLEYTPYCNKDELIEFITRGCNVEQDEHWYCVVPTKEGKLYQYRPVMDIVLKYQETGKTIRLLDNNFLQWGGHVEALKILIHYGVKCYFDQGLTIGLINDENAELLSKLNYGSTEYVFAFDDIKMQPIIEKKLEILKKYIIGDWKFKFYIFSHAGQPISEITHRANWCKENRVLPYIMRYDNCYTSLDKNFYTDLTAWCNQPAQFKKRTFEEFIYPRSKNNTVRAEKSLAIYKAHDRPALEGGEAQGMAEGNDCTVTLEV